MSRPNKHIVRHPLAQRNNAVRCSSNRATCRFDKFLVRADRLSGALDAWFSLHLEVWLQRRQMYLLHKHGWARHFALPPRVRHDGMAQLQSESRQRGEVYGLESSADQMLAQLERKVAHHRERQAFHAEQEVAHRDKQAHHAAALERALAIWSLSAPPPRLPENGKRPGNVIRLNSRGGMGPWSGGRIGGVERCCCWALFAYVASTSLRAPRKRSIWGRVPTVTRRWVGNA